MCSQHLHVEGYHCNSLQVQEQRTKCAKLIELGLEKLSESEKRKYRSLKESSAAAARRMRAWPLHELLTSLLLALTRPQLPIINRTVC